MTSSNKVPANWPAALKTADDVEEVAVAALDRILELVGSDYAGRRLVAQERKIRNAIGLLESGETDGALAALKE